MNSRPGNTKVLAVTIAGCIGCDSSETLVTASCPIAYDPGIDGDLRELMPAAMAGQGLVVRGEDIADTGTEADARLRVHDLIHGGVIDGPEIP